MKSLPEKVQNVENQSYSLSVCPLSIEQIKKETEVNNLYLPLSLVIVREEKVNALVSMGQVEDGKGSQHLDDPKTASKQPE